MARDSFLLDNLENGGELAWRGVEGGMHIQISGGSPERFLSRIIPGPEPKEAEDSLIGLVSVPVFSLRTLLRNESAVDVVHFDCQVCVCACYVCARVRVYVCMHLCMYAGICMYRCIRVYVPVPAPPSLNVCV